MSLVNKMLRDLDARRAGEAERGGLPTAVTPMPDEPSVSRFRLAALLVVAILAAAGAADYLGYLPSREPPALAASLAKAVVPAATNAPDTVAVVASPVPVPAAPAVLAQPAPTAPPPSVDIPPDRLSLRIDTDIDRLPPIPKPSPRAAVAAPKAPQAPVEATPRSKPAEPAKAPSAPAPVVENKPAPEPRIEKHERVRTAAEKAEAEFRHGTLAQRQGAIDEAAAAYRSALADQPEHAGARRALAGLLTEHRRYDDAEEVLRRGMVLLPAQIYWPMALARVKVERGEVAAGLDILVKHAAVGESSAEYQGFAAALFNRQGRNREAIERYEAATRLSPNEARWWAGLGIALDAGGRAAEARTAYLRARGMPGLPADLAAHVEQRLK